MACRTTQAFTVANVPKLPVTTTMPSTSVRFVGQMRIFGNLLPVHLSKATTMPCDWNFCQHRWARCRQLQPWSRSSCCHISCARAIIAVIPTISKCKLYCLGPYPSTSKCSLNIYTPNFLPCISQGSSKLYLLHQENISKIEFLSISPRRCNGATTNDSSTTSNTNSSTTDSESMHQFTPRTWPT